MKNFVTKIFIALILNFAIVLQLYSDIFISINNFGNSTNRILTKIEETNKEIISFKLSATGGNIAITSIKISLNYYGGAVDSDWTNGMLFIDNGIIGTYESSEFQIGNTLPEPSSGILYFGSITGFTIYNNSSTNLICILSHKQLSAGKGLKSFILNGFIKGTNSSAISNNSSITGRMKLVPSELFVSNITNGDAGSYIFTSAPESFKEILAFKISNIGSEDLIINNIYISLFYINGATNTNFSYAKLYEDFGVIGTFDGPDNQIGSTISSFTNILRFTNNFNLSANSKKNLLIIVNHSTLNYGEGLRVKIFYKAIESIGNYTATNIYSTNVFYSTTKKVPAGIFVSNISSGNANLKYITKSQDTDIEILCFKISATKGERIKINYIKVSLAYTNGANDSDWTNARICYDTGVIGNYESESIISTVTNPLNRLLIFSNITGLTLKENWSTNFLVIIDKKATGPGEGLKPYILSGFIKGYGLDTKTNITSLSNAIGMLKIGSTAIYITNEDIGDASDNYLTKNPENDKEIICLKISCDKGEGWSANTMKFSLIYSGGASFSDWTNAKLYADSGNIGTFDGTEIQLGNTISNIPDTNLVFNNITGFTIKPNKKTNVLLVISHKNMTPGESIKAQVKKGLGGFIGTGTYSGLVISNTNIQTGTIKQVPSDLYVSIKTQGDSAIKSFTKSSENYHELISIKISATYGENIRIRNLSLTLYYTNGSYDSYITNCRLFIDKNNNGTYDGFDTLLATLNKPNLGKINFTNISGLTILENSSTNLIVTIGHFAMPIGSGIQAFIKTNYISGIGIITGYTNYSYGSGQGILKKRPSDLIVRNINTGNVSSTFISKFNETNKEIICFNLSATPGENVTLSSIKISLYYQGGIF